MPCVKTMIKHSLKSKTGLVVGLNKNYLKNSGDELVFCMEGLNIDLVSQFMFLRDIYLKWRVLYCEKCDVDGECEYCEYIHTPGEFQVLSDELNNILTKLLLVNPEMYFKYNRYSNDILKNIIMDLNNEKIESNDMDILVYNDEINNGVMKPSQVCDMDALEDDNKDIKLCHVYHCLECCINEPNEQESYEIIHGEVDEYEYENGKEKIQYLTEKEKNILFQQYNRIEYFNNSVM